MNKFDNIHITGPYPYDYLTRSARTEILASATLASLSISSSLYFTLLIQPSIFNFRTYILLFFQITTNPYHHEQQQQHIHESDFSILPVFHSISTPINKKIRWFLPPLDNEPQSSKKTRLHGGQYKFLLHFDYSKEKPQ